MFPDSGYYLRSHLITASKPIIISSVILSLCFINNQSDIGLFNLYAGMLAIFFVIFINVLINSKAYWVYCIFSKKFMFNYISSDRYEYCSFIKNKTSFLFFYMIICFVIIYVSSMVLFVGIKLSQGVVISIIGFVLLPLLLIAFVKVISCYNLNESLLFLHNHTGNYVTNKKVTIKRIVFIEILAGTFTNVSIVPPVLERKSFLSINNGLDLDFIVSMNILLYSVLIVMLFLSKNKRMYVLMGFVLMKEMTVIKYNFQKTTFMSKLMTFLVIPPFVIIISFLFSFIYSPYNAELVYLLCLIPVYFIYYRVRMEALYNDLQHAFDMVLRLNALNRSIK